MSLSTMANKTGVSCKDPTYVNMTKDIDLVANSFANMELKSTKPPIIDKNSQVQLSRQERVKDKSEVTKEQDDPKSEPTYLNVQGRAPITGQLNKQYARAMEQRCGISVLDTVVPVPRPGNKRGGAEQTYVNLPTTDDSQKYMKPEHEIESYRRQMIRRHGTGHFIADHPPREPVESDERTYQNFEVINRNNRNNNHYENVTGPMQPHYPNPPRAPVSSPRTYISAQQQQEQALTDYILNSPPTAEYYNPQPPHATMSYQHTVDPVSAPSSQLLSPCTPQSVDSIGSPSQYSYSTQPSPNQCTYSQSGSPPRVQGHSQSMFSPPQHSPTAATNYACDVYGVPPMSSPAGSQNVPSPLSTTTDVSSPGELSLYNNVDSMNMKFYGGNNSQQQTSLNDTLDGLLHLEEFHPQLYPTTTASSFRGDNQGLTALQHNIGSLPGNSYNPASTSSHISTIPQSPYVLASPHNEEQPLSYSTCGKQVSLHQRVITSSAPVTNGPIYKMAIPPLPKPQPTDAQLPVVLFVIQPQKTAPPPPKAILPKPSGDVPNTQGTATKGKGKNSRKNSKNRSAAGTSGRTRGPQANVNEEAIKAKAMISLESDEALLRKENGETVLHQAIAMKKQSVILALLEAIQKRPGLAPLFYMSSDKEQTPLFLAVATGQTWLTETFVKMNANCNTLCRSEICQGQVEYLSPLHYACKFGDRCIKDVRAMLASKSTEVNMQSRSGMTALQLALWNHGHTDGKTKKCVDSRNVIKALLEAGADCSMKDNKTGKSALHFAVENGSLDITRLILESKCHVESLIDQKNYDHRTPLHFAVSLRTISEENKIDLVKYLISKGASKNCKDKNKLTPRELVSPTQVKILEVFSESASPSRSFNDDDDESYQLMLQSP